MNTTKNNDALYRGSVRAGQFDRSAYDDVKSGDRGDTDSTNH
jgi:hypothetical protein